MIPRSAKSRKYGPDFGFFDLILLICVLLSFLRFCSLFRFKLNNTSVPVIADGDCFIFFISAMAFFWFVQRRRRWVNRIGEPLGCTDWALIAWIVPTCIIIVFDIPEQGLVADVLYVCINALIFVLPVVIWFMWRRGWIHRIIRRSSSHAVPEVDPELLPPSRVYAIIPAKLDKWDPDRATGLVQSLLKHTDKTSLDLSIVATHEAIIFKVYLYHDFVGLDTMKSLVQAFYPDAQVSEAFAGNTSYPYHRQYMIFRRSQTCEAFAPLKSAADIKQSDPLVLLTQAMNTLRKNEVMEYSVDWRGAMNLSEKEIKRLLTQTLAEAGRPTPQFYPTKTFSESLEDVIARGIRDITTRVPKYSPAEERRHRAKLTQTLHMVTIQLCFETPDPDRLDWFSTVATPVRSLSDPLYPLIEDGYTRQVKITDVEKYNATHPHNVYNQWYFSEEETLEDRAEVHTFGVVPEELAVLWHLPHEGFTADKIQCAPNVPGEVIVGDGEARDRDNIIIGEVDHQRGRQKAAINRKDRVYHAYISGKTGTGKSTLIHHLIHQDIVAGHGVAVLDPHGTLINDVLDASIPDERLDDVVLLECGRKDYPVPLNPFRIPPGVSHEELSEEIYWLWHKIYEDEWPMGQTDRVVRNLVRTLIHDPKATPLDIRRILRDTEYRDGLLEGLEGRLSHSTMDFWEEYGRETESQQLQMARPVMNRTEALFGNRVIERMTCHPNSLNFRSFIQDKKIVLISLAGKAIRSEVDTLGAIFLVWFYMTVQGLEYRPGTKRFPFYLYIDEVGRYMTSPIPDMFSEARKFGLSLTLANQHFDQLNDKTLNGILGNVGTLLAFKCGDKDARRLASTFAEFDHQDLQDLDVYQVVVKTSFQGKTLPAFAIRTREPLPQADESRREHIRQHSIVRNKLLTEKEVDEWLRQRRSRDVSSDDTDDETPDDSTDTDTPGGDVGEDGLGSYEAIDR